MKTSMIQRAQPMQLIFVATALAIAGAACTRVRAASYVPDPTFNGGQMVVDNPGGSDGAGQKIAQGDNGDVIVAGIVPGVGDAAGHTKLALVRYNHAGVRQIWSNPGLLGNHDNQYVINRCIWGPAHCADDVEVKALVRHVDRLFVLVDEDAFVISQGNWIAVPQAFVFVFGMDGSLLHANAIDTHAYANDGSRTVLGGGIGVYETGLGTTTTTLVYAGSSIENGLMRPHFASYTVDDSTFWPATTPPMEPGFCSPASACAFTGLALGGRTSYAEPPRIYLSGYAHTGFPARWDVIAASIKPDGSLRTSFSGTGLYAEGGIGVASYGRKVAVEPGPVTDAIYVLVDVTRACRNGTAVEKLLSSGEPDATFGVFGVVQYGGSDEPDPQTCETSALIGWITTEYPTDLVYVHDKLGVAGLNIYSGGPCDSGQTCPEDNIDGEVTVLDSNTGAFDAWGTYAYSDTPGGTRSRHSSFGSIVANGDDTFSMAGDVRYFTNDSVPVSQRGKQMFATLRIAPFSDLLFKNGFE